MSQEKPVVASGIPAQGLNMLVCDARCIDVRENTSEKTKGEYPWRCQVQSFDTNLDLIAKVQPKEMQIFKYVVVKLKQSDQVSSFNHDHRAVKMFQPVALESVGPIH